MTVLAAPADRPAASISVPGAQRRLGRSRSRRGETIGLAVLRLAALVSILTTVGIVVALLLPTLEFFGDVAPREYLTSTDWAPLFEPPRFGVRPLITSTIVITAVALLVAVPLGLGAAIFLGEYAGDRTRKWVKPALELLAGVPTVVYGFFALTFITPLLQDLLPWEVEIFNGAAAGLAMGVMLMPTVASLSEDAMAASPRALREGAYALGSSRFQVATRVVVPSALSGIVAAVVLAFARAMGETMIVLLAAGGMPNTALNPLEAMQTLTAFIASAGLGDLPVGTTGYKTIFAVGSTLFVFTMAVNVLSIKLVARFRQVYE